MKSLVPYKHRHPISKRPPVRETVLFDDWFDPFWDPIENMMTPFSETFTSFMPSVDIYDCDKDITIRTELPGMSEKDIDVSLHDGILEINGESKSEGSGKRKGLANNDCGYTSFSRDIWLGNEVDGKGAKAHFKNGLLTIDLPKSKHAHNDVKIKVS